MIRFGLLYISKKFKCEKKKILLGDKVNSVSIIMAIAMIGILISPTLQLSRLSLSLHQ